MYFGDHVPPHFHALYGEFEALIGIRTFEVHPWRSAWPCNGARAEMGATAPPRTFGGLGIMHAESNAERNSPAAVALEVMPQSPWRVTSVEVLPGFRLKVAFADGLKGVVDMSCLVHSTKAGVFAALADPLKFAQVKIERGAVTSRCDAHCHSGAWRVVARLISEQKGCTVHRQASIGNRAITKLPRLRNETPSKTTS